MWAGQVSSPVRLEREEKKDECKEKARSGSASPCNFCSQLGFDGDFGFISTTNNKPGFCARFGFSEELFIFARFKPNACVKEVFATVQTAGKTQERKKERGKCRGKEGRVPLHPWAVLLKQIR